MKYVGGMLPDYWVEYIPPIPPGFAPMLIKFHKNIGKSGDKSYSTDQKTSFILVPTRYITVCFEQNRYSHFESHVMRKKGRHDKRCVTFHNTAAVLFVASLAYQAYRQLFQVTI